MKRSRRSQRKRERFDYDVRRHRKMPIISQPIDHKAPPPDDAVLLAELAWIQGLKDGHIPRLPRVTR
jgi:hypothetical protein